ncbi:hypothetical protein JW899_01930 [Candidatus Uhrbacteria bacterium]|nr:hypothetical protein [Candidatus Uhrbacteria bacterium]
MDLIEVKKILRRRMIISRYDYLLIWGHGLQHRDEILNLLRQDEDIEILKIIKHQINDMVRFVDVVYSYDYAPIEHLRGKTKYLLDTVPEVIFVFFRNLNAEESFVGEGEFRHIECRNIKRLKETIRDLYNPKTCGKRTEHHVVHASDNEMQTDVMLKYLGFESGTGVFARPNFVVDAPYHLASFRVFELKIVSIDKVICWIPHRENGQINPRPVSIEETPHYKALSGHDEEYKKYFEEYGGILLTDDQYLEKLRKIYGNISYLTGEYATNYIIAREVEDDKFYILDGTHRISSLKKSGIDKIVIMIARI